MRGLWSDNHCFDEIRIIARNSVTEFFLVRADLNISEIISYPSTDQYMKLDGTIHHQVKIFG